MSKGLSSFPESQRMMIARRRSGSSDKGLGYWGAVAYLNRHGIKTSDQARASAINDIMRNAGVEDNIMRREDKHTRLPRKQHTWPAPSAFSDRDKKRLASFR